MPFRQRPRRYHGRRLDPVPRLVRHAGHARRLLRSRADRALRRSRGRARARRSAQRRHSGERRGRDRGESERPPRSTSTICATRPRSSATRSCRSCTRWRSNAAKPAATCTGARPRRTSWTRRTCCRCAPRSISSQPTSRSCGASWAISPSATATRRWPGRTHLQQALPITFGYKAAIWRAMFDRHAERLAQLRPRVLVVEFAGAAGTLASLGDRGLDVQEALADELKLGVPASTWHVARDGFAEAVNFLGARHGLARQDRLRRDADDAKRARRSLRAVRHRPRREQHHAAEAQSDFERAHARRGQGRAPARGPHARRDGAGLRARDRTLARGMDRDSRELRAHRRRAAPGEVHARRTGRRRSAHAQEPRPDVGPHRRRSGDDGSRAAHRPADARTTSCTARAASSTRRAARWPTCWLPDPEISKHLDRAAIERLTDPANYLGMAPQMVDRVLASR